MNDSGGKHSDSGDKSSDSKQGEMTNSAIDTDYLAACVAKSVDERCRSACVTGEKDKGKGDGGQRASGAPLDGVDSKGCRAGLPHICSKETRYRTHASLGLGAWW